MTITDRLKDLMLVFFCSCFAPQGWRKKFDDLIKEINTLEMVARDQKYTIRELMRRVEELESIINAQAQHPKKEITEIILERL